jgi:hypothetical protein
VCFLALLSLIAVVPGAGGFEIPPLERIRGVYLQQSVELAAVGNRLVMVTRMTRFTRCGMRHPLAEDLNEHTVEVLGIDLPGVGFIAGIVDAVEGCEDTSARLQMGPGGR